MTLSITCANVGAVVIALKILQLGDELELCFVTEGEFPIPRLTSAFSSLDMDISTLSGRGEGEDGIM